VNLQLRDALIAHNLLLLEAIKLSAKVTPAGASPKVPVERFVGDDGTHFQSFAASGSGREAT
jgi:hypothetical protein